MHWVICCFWRRWSRTMWLRNLMCSSKWGTFYRLVAVVSSESRGHISLPRQLPPTTLWGNTVFWLTSSQPQKLYTLFTVPLIPQHVKNQNSWLFIPSLYRAWTAWSCLVQRTSFSCSAEDEELPATMETFWDGWVWGRDGIVWDLLWMLTLKLWALHRKTSPAYSCSYKTSCLGERQHGSPSKGATDSPISVHMPLWKTLRTIWWNQD